MADYAIRTRRWTRRECENSSRSASFDLASPSNSSAASSWWPSLMGRRTTRLSGRRRRRSMLRSGRAGLFGRQGPIGLDEESEPEPDVAVVPGGPEDYRNAHPSRPVLTVEVAESSLESDRERKGSLYARANLEDYWVVNLETRVLEVYREPAVDPSAMFGWRYTRRGLQSLGRGNSAGRAWRPRASCRPASLTQIKLKLGHPHPDPLPLRGRGRS